MAAKVNKVPVSSEVCLQEDKTSWQFLLLCRMKNLVIDFGNTRAKTGVFQDHRLIDKNVFTDVSELQKFIAAQSWDNSIISSVSQEASVVNDAIRVWHQKIALQYTTPLPITLAYKTPETLGVDRIAGACGAIDIFPNQNCLLIDAGTCVNYEFIDEKKIYHGGAISPGIKMRFDAMHTFTSKLPLVTATETAPLTGDSTISCMQSGVINGIVAEVEGIIHRYTTNYPNLGVILCGGDYSVFENKLKPSIFVAPDLVLSGLNRILLHNAG